jgi:hypothetical protein
MTLADLALRLAPMLNPAALAGDDCRPTLQTPPATVKRAVLRANAVRRVHSTFGNHSAA